MNRSCRHRHRHRHPARPVPPSWVAEPAVPTAHLPVGRAHPARSAEQAAQRPGVAGGPTARRAATRRTSAGRTSAGGAAGGGSATGGSTRGAAAAGAAARGGGSRRAGRRLGRALLRLRRLHRLGALLRALRGGVALPRCRRRPGRTRTGWARDSPSATRRRRARCGRRSAGSAPSAAASREGCCAGPSVSPGTTTVLEDRTAPPSSDSEKQRQTDGHRGEHGTPPQHPAAQVPDAHAWSEGAPRLVRQPAVRRVDGRARDDQRTPGGQVDDVRARRRRGRSAS